VRPCREEEDEERENEEEGEFGFDVHDVMLPHCARTVKHLVVNVRFSSFVPVAERCFLLKKTPLLPWGLKANLESRFLWGRGPLISLYSLFFIFYCPPPPWGLFGGFGSPGVCLWSLGWYFLFFVFVL